MQKINSKILLLWDFLLKNFSSDFQINSNTKNFNKILFLFFVNQKTIMQLLKAC